MYMGQHFSKRRRKKNRSSSYVAPSDITIKEELIYELDKMQEQLVEIRNIYRPPTPISRQVKDS